MGFTTIPHNIKTITNLVRSVTNRQEKMIKNLAETLALAMNCERCGAVKVNSSTGKLMFEFEPGDFWL